VAQGHKARLRATKSWFEGKNSTPWPLMTLIIIVEWRPSGECVEQHDERINERMALAATLNAKVCTSLSSRYVASAVPSLRQRYHLDRVAGSGLIGGSGGLDHRIVRASES